MTSILISKNSTLSMHEEPIEPSTIIDERTTSYDEIYGEGNWVILDADSLPADFSVETYTIEGGELVPASAELIAVRKAAALVASREAVRVAREARYESEPIKSLYWSWIESGLEADRAAWIAAKNAVRTELPYPETPIAV